MERGISGRGLAKAYRELLERKLRGEISQKTLEIEAARLLKGGKSNKDELFSGVGNAGGSENSGKDIEEYYL